MANVKGKIKVKVEANKSKKPVKAKLSSNNGGIFTTKVAAIVSKSKSKSNGK